MNFINSISIGKCSTDDSLDQYRQSARRRLLSKKYTLFNFYSLPISQSRNGKNTHLEAQTDKQKYLKALETEELNKQKINQNLIDLAQSLQKNYSNTSSVLNRDLEVSSFSIPSIFIRALKSPPTLSLETNAKSVPLFLSLPTFPSVSALSSIFSPCSSSGSPSSFVSFTSETTRSLLFRFLYLIWIFCFFIHLNQHYF